MGFSNQSPGERRSRSRQPFTSGEVRALRCGNRWAPSSFRESAARRAILPGMVREPATLSLGSLSSAVRLGANRSVERKSHRSKPLGSAGGGLRLARNWRAVERLGLAFTSVGRQFPVGLAGIEPETGRVMSRCSPSRPASAALAYLLGKRASPPKWLQWVSGCRVAHLLRPQRSGTSRRRWEASRNSRAFQ